VRIIAGEFRGRRIAAPKGKETRPMLDRVRESLFSTLGDLVPGARVLDLFAGTGSLGLEALSRGAQHVRFVERDRSARELLTQNLATLQVGSRAELSGGDALSPKQWSRDGIPPAATLVLMDPPYPLWRDRRGRTGLLEAVGRLLEDVLEQGGVMVLHTHPRDLRVEDLPASAAPECRVYGNTALWYLWPSVGTGAEE